MVAQNVILATFELVSISEHVARFVDERKELDVNLSVYPRPVELLTKEIIDFISKRLGSVKVI